MAHKLFLFNFLVLPLVLISCNSIEPPPDETVTLKLEDVSCIEAWIKITTNNIQLPAEVTLKKNNTIEKTISLLKQDSVIYINSLLPKTTYNFQAFIHTNTQTYESNELSVTTMDTTSHNFTWQSWTFGEHSSSVLYDVAIINENNIWAVGEIFMNDSLGNPDPHIYNAVHWDGTHWQVKRIPFTGSCSAVIYPPIRSVFAFTENDIWFARGGSLVHFDGTIYTNDCGMNSFLTGSINKIWGTSSNDLYIVGNNGNIAHYTNGQWTKIESDVSTDLLDIYGKGEEIYLGGWRDFQPSVLLKLKNGIVQKIIEDEDNLFNYRTDYISGAIYSVWMTEKKLYVLTWYDLYRANINTDGIAEATWKGPIQDWGMISVRGNNVNDIIAAGVPGKIWHYNGINWYTYNELIDSRDRLRRIEIKDNICVAVGYRYENGIIDKAIVTIGRR